MFLFLGDGFACAFVLHAELVLYIALHCLEFVLHAELVLRIPLHCLEFVFYAAKPNKPV